MSSRSSTPLVAGAGNQTEPAYSQFLNRTPLLAYVSDQTGQREIWLRDSAGALSQLTTDGAGYANPDFAGRLRLLDPNADGTIDTFKIGLAFESTRGGPRAIWALDVELTPDGRFVAVRDLRRAASGPQDLGEPSWQTVNDRAPGTNVVFSRVNDILFTTAEAGTTYLDYVEEPWTQADSGPVTPAVPFAGPSAITRFPLTGDPGGDSGPVWAPNGDLVAFSRTAADNSDIWRCWPTGRVCGGSRALRPRICTRAGSPARSQRSTRSAATPAQGPSPGEAVVSAPPALAPAPAPAPAEAMPDRGTVLPPAQDRARPLARSQGPGVRTSCTAPGRPTTCDLPMRTPCQPAQRQARCPPEAVASP